MITRLVTLTVFAMASSAGFSGAQDAKDVPPPVPPLVAPVAENMDWIVTAKYPQKPAAVPATSPRADWRIAEVHSTKTGKLKRDLIKLMDGTTKENWFIDSLVLWKTNQGEVSVSDMSGAPERADDGDSPSIPSGFPGVGWVKMENYTGVVSFEKQLCYHYAGGSMEAWIGVQSHLPVAYKSTNGLFQFKFNDAPTGMLELPPDYKNAWDISQKLLGHRAQLRRDLGRK